MQQYSFEFTSETIFRQEDFLLSPVNQDAYAWIEKWPERLNNERRLVPLPFTHALMVHGASGCGKTHLAHLWQQRTQAVFLTRDHIYSPAMPALVARHPYIIVEHCHTIHDESALLHFFNTVREADGYVLFTSRLSPGQMNIRLPDLRSRLNAIPVLEIAMPDDALLQLILQKLFADRQLRVPKEVIDFLIVRMERSFTGACALVEKIDTASLHEKRSVTIPFVRKILAGLTGEGL